MQRQTFTSDCPTCCICLDELTSPASLPCGHRFCLGCIGEYWRIPGACQCPLCKTLFPTRPQLKKDQTFHPGAQTSEASAPLKAGEIPCDLCPARRRAVKSCLQCMASYCAAHLEPHYWSEELGRHLLISVVKNLEDSVCRLHGKPLSRFCRTDQTCICATCAQSEHRGHRTSSVNSEAARKKVKPDNSVTPGDIQAKLKRKRMKLQQTIQERLSKVEKVRRSVDLSGENPKEAQELIREVEEEICELQEKHSELEKLAQTEDNLHFLQKFLRSASS